MRNGTTVTGNWWSADISTIQFLTDDKLQTYSKSDVLEVTFGSVAAVTAAPVAAVSTPPSPVKVQAPQTVYGPEP